MSIFGRIYRVTTFGESHAAGVGCVVDGFPSNFSLDLNMVQSELNRRKPGQSKLSTQRKQTDMIECISGIERGKTLGSPLCFLVRNQDMKPQDYSKFDDIPRPGHADITYLKKYGIKAVSGGGRSSARQTIGRVIAGALAKQFLATKNIQFCSWVYSAGLHCIPNEINQNYIKANEQQINLNSVANIRCPHFETACNIYKQIEKARNQQDSIGGCIQGCVYGLPIGLGQPVFDKMQAVVGGLILSIPAVKGFQFGSGFEGTRMRGKPITNFAGGSLGGISNGATFTFKVAFKPVSTIGKTQKTANYSGQIVELQGKGRHDPCVLPRATAIIDNTAAMAIMDLWLRNQSCKQ